MAADPTLPYARWGDALTVLDTQLSFTGMSEAPDTSSAIEEELSRAWTDDRQPLADRYAELGCTVDDEAQAVASHLGLPTSGVQRDMAAFEAMSDLIATAQDSDGAATDRDPRRR